MNPRRFRLSFLPLCFATAALAQFNRAGPPGGRVVLFENANFRGGVIVLYPG